MITLIFGKVAVLGGATRLSPCPTIPIEQAQSSEPWYHAIPAERLSKRRTQPPLLPFRSAANFNALVVPLQR